MSSSGGSRGCGAASSACARAMSGEARSAFRDRDDDELVVVIDHNPALLTRATEAWGSRPQVQVVANAGGPPMNLYLLAARIPRPR